MAILPTPSVNAIGVVDPSYSYTISFSYTGSQSTKNRAVITDNDTYEVLYDKTISALKLYHTIPAGTCQAGKTYTIKVQVSDSLGNSSNFSQEVLFYCITTPIFQFNEIPNPCRMASLTVSINYQQAQGEKIKSYQYLLYDFSHKLVNKSDILYGDIEEFTFQNLENNTQYYLRCTATTVHNLSLDTGEYLISVLYDTVPFDVLLQLENHPCAGYISLNTNMIDVEYILENDNYIFNADKSVTIYDNSLTYTDGFIITDNFILYLGINKIQEGTFLQTKDDEFSLSVIRLGSQYYCELKANKYVVYKSLTRLTNLMIELKRENNIYNLVIHYED